MDGASWSAGAEYREEFGSGTWSNLLCIGMWPDITFLLYLFLLLLAHTYVTVIMIPVAQGK